MDAIRLFSLGVVALFMGLAACTANASHPSELPESPCSCENDPIYTVDAGGIDGDVTVNPGSTPNLRPRTGEINVCAASSVVGVLPVSAPGGMALRRAVKSGRLKEC